MLFFHRCNKNPAFFEMSPGRADCGQVIPQNRFYESIELTKQGLKHLSVRLSQNQKKIDLAVKSEFLGFPL
jgi:hypothetical protein